MKTITENGDYNIKRHWIPDENISSMTIFIVTFKSEILIVSKKKSATIIFFKSV